MSRTTCCSRRRKRCKYCSTTNTRHETANQGLIPPGQQSHRNVLFDQLYASIPKRPRAKVQIYTAELAPEGWTNFHCHNGATFFLALQGVFEAHFEEGI